MGILSFEAEWTRKRPDYPHLLRYIREGINKEKVEWGDLTTLNLSRVRDHLCDTVAANSAVTYLAVLKAFLAYYEDEDIIPCKKPERILKARKVPSEHVALTADEIRRIENYMPKTDIEKRTKAQFLCEYYSLARKSDVEEFTENNIGDDSLSYVSQKTKVATTVPLHHNFKTYFEQCGEPLWLSTYNRNMKNICRKCGINQRVKLFYRGKETTGEKWEFVGSHTARRSAATELAMRNVPIATISRLMNHAGRISTTERYIVADTQNLGDEAMSFFNKN